jgi:Kef-type K+ transport system membrane component KefB
VRFDPTSLVLITAAVALAPIVSAAVRVVLVPTVVVELILGIAIGPDVLDIAHEGPFVTFLAGLGMSFLFFLAGMELDLARVRGRPLRAAASGMGVSLVLAAIAAGALAVTGAIDVILPVAIALTTTAVGTLIPILRDAGELDSPFGTQVLATGAVGEFVPIVLIAVFLAGEHGTFAAIAVLVLFVLVAAGLAGVALRARPPHVVNTIKATLHASGQLGVRLALLALFFLLWVAYNLHLDLALAGFAAGLLVGVVTQGAEADPVRMRLEGIGFGLFVPFFFVTSGLRLDLDALLSSTTALVLLPVFLACFLLVRGTPAVLARPTLGPGAIVPLALCSATALPLVVAVTAIAVEEHELSGELAASLVGAGLVSVMVFPAAAIALRRTARAAGVASETLP